MAWHISPTRNSLCICMLMTMTMTMTTPYVHYSICHFIQHIHPAHHQQSTHSTCQFSNSDQPNPDSSLRIPIPARPPH
jgi:hypothetical protein